MARTYTYNDALKILGHGQSPLGALSEKLVAAGTEATAVPGLSTLVNLFVSYGKDAATTVRERLSGVDRLTRSERIAAAHHMIAIGAFFEVVEETLVETEPRYRPDPRDLRATELGRLLDVPDASAIDNLGIIRLLTTRVPLPSPQHSFEENCARVGGTFALACEHVNMLSGKAAGISEEAYTDLFTDHFDARSTTERAVRRYTDHYRSLMAAVPEFDAWAGMLDHQATRHTVRATAEATYARIEALGTGMAALQTQLEAMSTGAAMDDRRRELALRYRAALTKPVLPTTEAPEGITLPTLADAYLDPRGRVTEVGADSRPSVESWWELVDVHDDLPGVLAGLLTSPDALDLPLVVLGHPGAGKSKLTEILAARLPGAEFLAVRVELRTVAPDAPVQDQIEQAVRETTGERVPWPELARSAKGALPVVMLDGFDELVQATGVNRSDYLEQVRDFQRREAELGRPVAVLVTSRTVVADRMRFPDGTTAIRLEALNDAQIGRMLDIWNAHNRHSLEPRGLAPLPLATLLAHRDLAEQPLLLIMLLLFDAGGNALQRHRDGLGRAGLYEQILTSFAEREVHKQHANLSGRQFADAVDEELSGLEFVAVAMFVRHRQTVTADELGADLAALADDGTPDPGAADPGMHGRVSAADRLLGRFFFIHESRARQESAASVYEFLHATFSEYLVARLITGSLKELAEDHKTRARRRRTAGRLDDGMFYAVTSFAAVSGRAAVVEFARDLLDAHFADHPEDRDTYLALLTDLLRDAPYGRPNRSFAGYEPVRLPLSTREAIHSANLLVLIVQVHPEPIDIADLLDPAANVSPMHEWRRMAGLWRGMADEEWHGLIDCVRVRHLDFWAGEGRGRSVVQREGGEPLNLGECIGFGFEEGPISAADPYGVVLPLAKDGHVLLRSTALRFLGTAANQYLLLMPFISHVDRKESLATYWADVRADLRADRLVPSEERSAYSHPYDLMELRLGRPDAHPRLRLAIYKRLLTHPHGRYVWITPLRLVVLRQAAEDLALLPQEDPTAAGLREILADYLKLEEAFDDRTDVDFARRTLDLLEPHLPYPEVFAGARRRLARYADLPGTVSRRPAEPAEDLPRLPTSDRGSDAPAPPRSDPGDAYGRLRVRRRDQSE
ncbi:hypothetical protein CLV63_102345 [Murinocardiopsis flavida]|uniref:NACHT N-terminal Helical domain-containing protein n=1 Tax=Murinocardiopsis flavida TaxID=645275 RepID=A0A2P8DSN7_9ACTN|nr:hypothetical protein [Murinocardiopsis flavida]PSL00218.1 hypothetical protein CLV63_102345 [Murinocardiopsis flavida]